MNRFGFVIDIALTFDSAQSNSSWRVLRYGENTSRSNLSKTSLFCAGIFPCWAAGCWSIVFTDVGCTAGTAVADAGMPLCNKRSKSTSQLTVLIASNATEERERGKHPIFNIDHSIRDHSIIRLQCNATYQLWNRPILSFFRIWKWRRKKCQTFELTDTE